MAIHFKQAKVLTDKCNILRLPVAADDCGMPVGAMTTVASDIACRLLPMRNGKEFMVEKQVAISMYTVYIMPFDGLTEHDFLEINGLTYDVIQVPPVILAGLPIDLTVQLVKP